MNYTKQNKHAEKLFRASAFQTSHLSVCVAYEKSSHKKLLSRYIQLQSEIVIHFPSKL